MRQDIHCPRNFDPADYTYLTSFDNSPYPGAFKGTPQNYPTEFGNVIALNPAHAHYTSCRRQLNLRGSKIHFNPDEGTSQCDHCGAFIRYVAIFQHKSSELIAVGEICAVNAFGCVDRMSYDIKRLKVVAASQRQQEKAFGKALTFIQENAPALENWMLDPIAKDVSPIFADMNSRLIKYGTLSEKQIKFAHKLLSEFQERQRNGGKTDRELEFERQRELAEDCPTGKIVVSGVIVKKAPHESMYGVVDKITVKDDRGFLVWMTCPAVIDRADVGSKVSMMVDVKPSDKDTKFGFGKRPTQAQIRE